MLLYIHVPFCRVKCRYCAFYSLALGKNAPASACEAMQKYMDVLMAEMAIWGSKLGARSFSSLFIGGGTPSLLSPAMIHQILDKVAQYFHLAVGAEISMEANPESVGDVAMVKAWLNAGINRISLGVQSLDDAMLRMLGRVHCGEDVLRAVSRLREAGCMNLNLDLMWALPGQSVQHWLHTLERVLLLRPEHISAYALTLEEGTVLEREAARGLVRQPDESEQEVMFLEGASLLEENGYKHYEISNFARQGFACRHNIGYWSGQEYLGLGPAATSTLQNRRWTNPGEQQAWADAVARHCLGEDAEVLTHEVRVLELIMLRLRTAQGLCLASYNKLTGHDFVSVYDGLLRGLCANKLARIHDGYLQLTRQGMLLSNSIIGSFFEQIKK